MDGYDARHWLQLSVSAIELLGILAIVQQRRVGFLVLALVGVEYFCAARWIYLREWGDPIFFVYTVGIALWAFGYLCWETIAALRWLEKNTPDNATLKQWADESSPPNTLLADEEW